MVTNPSELSVAPVDDDILIDVDDVPLPQEITFKFRFGGTVYTARAPKDSVFLETIMGANRNISTDNFDDMFETIWRSIAMVVDQDSFDDIKRRYLDPEDEQATAARILNLVQRLLPALEEKMGDQLGGLFEVKKKKTRKKPQDRQPKQT